MSRKNNLTAYMGDIMVNQDSDVVEENTVKYNKIQEHKNLADEQSDEHEKDILMVTMPGDAVVSKSIWEISRVTFMVIVIITLLMILLVLYVTDVPVILIPSY